MPFRNYLLRISRDPEFDSNRRDAEFLIFDLWASMQCRIITSELTIWHGSCPTSSTPSEEGPVFLVALQRNSYFAFYTVESEPAFGNDVKQKWLHSTLPCLGRLPFILSS